MNAHEAHEYTFIRAWGLMLGSQFYYIRSEQERAAVNGAPLNAIYRNQDGYWVTTDELTTEQRTALGRLVKL